MPKTKYIWDEDNILYETDGNDAVTAQYTYSPEQYGNLISEYRGGTTYTHYYDAQGSTVALTDDTGHVTDTFVYNAWGEEVARTGTTETPWRWIGKVGYYYNGERQSFDVRWRGFAPAVARWLTKDPLGLDLYSLYVYVHNRSLFAIDPTGLDDVPLPVIPIPELPLPTPLIVPEFPSGSDLLAPAQKCCGKCDVKAFNVLTLGINQYHTLRGPVYGVRKGILATFQGACCRCCQYRQSVRDLTRLRAIPNGNWEYAIPPHGASWGEWGEDRPPGRGYGYGWRDYPGSTDDRYSDPDRRTGCKYTGNDVIGVITDVVKRYAKTIHSGIEVSFKAEFRGYVIDVCHYKDDGTENVIAERSWTVDFTLQVSP